MTLPSCLKRFAHLIAEVSDERKDGDGYWVYLIPGYWSPDDETHCIHKDTPRECVFKLKWSTLGYGYKISEIEVRMSDRAREMIRELDVELCRLRRGSKRSIETLRRIEELKTYRS